MTDGKVGLHSEIMRLSIKLIDLKLIEEALLKLKGEFISEKSKAILDPSIEKAHLLESRGRHLFKLIKRLTRARVKEEAIPIEELNKAKRKINEITDKPIYEVEPKEVI